VNTFTHCDALIFQTAAHGIALAVLSVGLIKEIVDLRVKSPVLEAFQYKRSSVTAAGHKSKEAILFLVSTGR